MLSSLRHPRRFVKILATPTTSSSTHAGRWSTAASTTPSSSTTASSIGSSLLCLEGLEGSILVQSKRSVRNCCRCWHWGHRSRRRSSDGSWSRGVASSHPCWEIGLPASSATTGAGTNWGRWGYCNWCCSLSHCDRISNGRNVQIHC